MSEELKPIFEKSACLSKRQMKEYLAGTMTREECHALEHHITNCEFCSEALDGMMLNKEEAIVAMEELNPQFIKEHFIAIPAKISHNASSETEQKTFITPDRKNINLYRSIGIAAILLIGFGAMWYYDHVKDTPASPIAQEIPAHSQETPQISTYDTESAIGKHEKSVQHNTVASPAESVLKNDGSVSAPAEVAIIAPPTSQASIQAAMSQQNEAREEQKVVKEPISNNAINKEDAIKEMPARNVADVAETSAGIYKSKKADKLSVSGARTSGTSYVTEGTATDDMRSREEAETSEADKLYESGKYSNALAIYRKTMSTSGDRSRQQSALMAAKCYLGMGQKVNARKLLQQLVEEGSGSSKRQARRLLRELEADQ